MKKIALILVPLLLLAGAATWWFVQRLLPPPAQAAATDPRHAELATRFLDLLDSGRYEEALAMADDTMRAALDAEKLASVWTRLPDQLGARTGRSAFRGERVGDTDIVTATLTFPVLALDARVAFDDADRISGFRLVPAQAAASPAAEHGDEWTEADVAVGQGDDALPGTLTRPRGSGPFPGVVLVHGSGPHDRDETIGPNKPFRDLAHGLAERGIAVLRYEKRSRAHPDSLAGRGYTIDDEVTDDAVAAVAAVRSRTGIDPDRVFVLGHSLGAMLAPRIAERDPRIAGLILLAAPARPLEDIVPRQIRHLAGLEGANEAEIQSRLAPLEQQRAVVKVLDETIPGTTPMMLDLPASYWRSLAGIDPVASARALRQPLLVLQGGRDYQVTPADDFARWQAAFDGDPRVRLRAFPELGHLFMPGGEPPGPKDYLVAGNVDPAVIAAIADWIGAVSPGAQR